MQKTILLPILFLFEASSIAIAGNPEYRCEDGTVDHDAVAVAYSDVDVGVFSDPDNSVCTFSVGGAGGEGADTSDEAPPINDLFERALGGDFEPIIFRLTTPRSFLQGQNSDYIGILNDHFNQEKEAFENCVDALNGFESSIPEQLVVSNDVRRTFEGTLPYLHFQSDDVSIGCAVVKPGQTQFVATQFPTLHLHARTGSTLDCLFIPSNALE